MSRARQANALEEGHDVSSEALVHALSCRHDVHVVEHGEQARRGGVNGTDHRASSLGDLLQQGNALR